MIIYRSSWKCPHLMTCTTVHCPTKYTSFNSGLFVRNFKADETKNLVSSGESSEQSFPWKWNLIPQNTVEVGYFLSQSDCRGAFFFFPPSRLLGPALISSTALQIFLPQILSEGHQLLFWHSAAWRQLRIEKRRSGCCGWSVQLGASSPLLFIA